MEAQTKCVQYTPNNSTTSDPLVIPSTAVGRYLAKLFLLLALSTICLIGIRDVSFCLRTYSSPAAHALVEGYGALLTVGVVYCLWVQYCVTAERRLLLATIGLSGGAAAQLLHGTVTSAHFGTPSIFGQMVLYFAFGWQFVLGLLLIRGAYDETLDDPQSVRRGGLRSIVYSLVLSAGAAWCCAAVAQYNGPALRLIPHQVAILWQYLKTAVPPDMALYPLVFTMAIIALYAVARSSARREDLYTSAMTTFLFLATLSQAATLVSGGSENAIWWLAHGFRLSALAWLLIYFAREFGASYADAHSRIAHLEAVHYLSSSLTNTLDLRVVLLAMVSDASKMLSARFASVMLADEEGRTLTTQVTFGLPELALNPRQPQDVEGGGRPAFYSGHTARSFREKRIVVVDDVYSDVEFIPWRTLARYDGYAVSVPLVYQDVALGVLNLFFEKHIPLNDEKIRLFQTLASAAAVAIANAQLYEKSVSSDMVTAEEVIRISQLRQAS